MQLPPPSFFFFFFNLFYFWLCWVFVSVRGLSPVVASGGHSSSRCAGLSLSRPFLLRSTSSRRVGSAIVAHGPSRSAACGILPDQGSNPCPLHWQADSQPLRHQGSPHLFFNFIYLFIFIYGCVGSSFLCEGFSLVAASEGHSSSRCVGLSLSWLVLLRSTGSRRAGSVIVAHRASCSEACGIFPDQGSNPRPPHQEADSQPLRHQGSPPTSF